MLHRFQVRLGGDSSPVLARVDQLQLLKGFYRVLDLGRGEFRDAGIPERGGVIGPAVVEYVQRRADHRVVPLLEIAVARFVEFAACGGAHLLERLEMLVAEIFRLRFLEPEKAHERLDALGRHVPLALQDFHEKARVHVDCGREDAVAERRVQRLFEFVELLHELAVVGEVVNVYFAFREHGCFPVIKIDSYL